MSVTLSFFGLENYFTRVTSWKQAKITWVWLDSHYFKKYPNILNIFSILVPHQDRCGFHLLLVLQYNNIIYNYLLNFDLTAIWQIFSLSNYLKIITFKYRIQDLYKRYLKIDQHLARHSKHNSLCSQIITPFSHLRISTNQETGL